MEGKEAGWKKKFAGKSWMHHIFSGLSSGKTINCLVNCRAIQQIPVCVAMMRTDL